MAKGAIEVKVAGLSELSRNFAKFAAEIKGKVLRSAARKAALKVRNSARAIADAKGLRDTGAMIKAIDARRRSKESRPGYEVFAVGVFKVRGGQYARTKENARRQRVGKEYEVDAPEFYWKFHEFGTVKMRKRPFLVPAFDLHKNSSAAVMNQEIIAGMARAERKLSKPPRPRKG